MTRLGPPAFLACLALAGCSGSDDRGLTLTAITFNVGTTPSLPHDDPPDDGYTSTEARASDDHYGDGLAWAPVVEDVRAFLQAEAPDLVAFQEVFYSPECAAVPAEARAGFVCETWADGDPTVAEVVLGAGYQIACNLEREDKCVGVRRRFGTWRGCDGALCLNGLAGSRVPDCGGGSRVGRGVVELVAGGELTVVHLHGTSGFSAEDQQCRIAQIAQIFDDLGDGEPGANGAQNVILGDLNTDPGRALGLDGSADAWAARVGDGSPFRFLTETDPSETPTYRGMFSIDHVVSDAFVGDCRAIGVTSGTEPVSEVRYLDHVPIVCDLAERAP
ncbi:MAG: hypothetical protein ACFCGT_22300 [Sandaracinaceae bacterium]